MNIDLTPIIEAIIVLLATIITCKVVPWIKARTTNEQQVYIMATIKTLVFAAEQIYGSGAGAEKMQYVKTKLEECGYTVDVDMIEAVIRENIAAIHTAKPRTEINE